MGDKNRRSFLFQLLAGTGLSAGSMASGYQDLDKPNLILILVDDLGWADLKCFGSEAYETPNIDRLAEHGIRFTQAYASSPVCSPTRASILTGKYPARLHLTNWLPGHNYPWAKLREPRFDQQLQLSEITIAEALSSSGYVCAHIGKWHLGSKEYYPERQGFDLNVGGTHQGSPPSYFPPYGIQNLEAAAQHEHLTDRLASAAERFLESNRNRAFFLYWAPYAVHQPLQAEPALVQKYEAKLTKARRQNNPTYAAMIETLDRAVGRILEKLEHLGLSRRTLVIFTSDNGGLTLRGTTDNYPLREGKGTAYEGGLRVPFIARWPGVIPAGQECPVAVSSVDLFPTLTALAGGRAHSPESDGSDLSPLLLGKGNLKTRRLFWHYPHYHPGGASPFGAIRDGDFKLILYYEDDRVELYNLKDDRGELRDLASDLPEKADELRSALEAWLKACDAQMPVPNPAFDPTRQMRRPGREVK